MGRAVNDNHKRSIGRALQCANDNVRAAVTVEEMSSAAGMSPFHFSRVFKTITGVSPHQYIVQKRIEHSMKLLVASGTPIAHIAIECGFCSQAHFSATFRARVGFSPREFRCRGPESQD